MSMIPDLTEENYFSPPAERYYMGSTQYKRFRACEAKALAVLRGEWREEWREDASAALLVGSYVDAHFSGTLDEFRGSHPELFKRDGTLKAEYLHAEAIIQRIERDPAFMAALEGEKQVIMTGEIEGVPVKIKVDVLQPYRIVDMKIMKDMEDVWDPEEQRKVPFWRFWGYDLQGAIYREVVRQNTALILPFGLAVATKEKPEPDIALIQLPASVLDEALEVVRQDIAYYDGLKQGIFDGAEHCGKCPYCRSTKVLAGWEVPDAC